MLVLKKKISENSVLLFGKIQEDLADLIVQFKAFNDYEEELKTLNQFKSNGRKKEWLSTRLLISNFFTEKTKIYYDDFGKPFLKNNYRISISHSKELIVIALSKNEEIGVDVEFISTKIKKIAHKFLHKEEIKQIEIETDLVKLYLHWCAKEALYKIYGKKNLHFIENLRIEAIDKKKDFFTGNIIINKKKTAYKIQYINYNGFIVLWAKIKERKLEKGNIYTKFCRKKKQFAILFDPDKSLDKQKLQSTVKKAEAVGVDFIFVGGSLISNSINELIAEIKKTSQLPILIFPGNAIQVSENADAILFLSLISGRNPEFLIGNHVVAAPFLKKSNVEIISTGYILIEGGVQSSVEYMSNTKAIPHKKTDIAVATALAGEMLGNKLIYLEAGSGASKAVSPKMISEVKKNISVPLIVGGGIKTKQDIKTAFNSGADIVVIGTAIEENSDLIAELKV